MILVVLVFIFLFVFILVVAVAVGVALFTVATGAIAGSWCRFTTAVLLTAHRAITLIVIVFTVAVAVAAFVCVVSGVVVGIAVARGSACVL